MTISVASDNMTKCIFGYADVRLWTAHAAVSAVAQEAAAAPIVKYQSPASCVRHRPSGCLVHRKNLLL